MKEEKSVIVVTQEEIDALTFQNACNFTVGVVCFNKTRCEKCGWNPRVSRRRIRKIRKELGL